MQAIWSKPGQAEPDPKNDCPQALAHVVHMIPRHCESAVGTATVLARESPPSWPLAWRTLPSRHTWWPCLKLEDWYPKKCYMGTLPVKSGKKSRITGVKVKVLLCLSGRAPGYLGSENPPAMCHWQSKCLDLECVF